MRANSTLNLYRRHTPLWTKTNLGKVPAKMRRFWMMCDCPIWMDGRTPSGTLCPQQTCGTRDLKVAEGMKAAAMAADAKTAHSEAIHGLTIEECIRKYLASRRAELGERGLRACEVALERLRAYVARHGARYASDLTVDLLADFKAEGLVRQVRKQDGYTESTVPLMETTAAKNMEKVLTFLTAGKKRRWITEDLAEEVGPLDASSEETSPFEEPEVDTLLAGALQMNGGRHGYAGHPETFHLLILFTLETGMRTAAAVRYNPSMSTWLPGTNQWSYRFLKDKMPKTSRPIYVNAYLSDELKQAIDSCVWMSPTRPFQIAGKDSSYCANEVYERMKGIGKKFNIENCHPHRLRDTFAKRKLLAGVSLDDLSKLLHHSSVKVTEKYYAKWVPERQDRLERVAAASRPESRLPARSVAGTYQEPSLKPEREVLVA